MLDKTKRVQATDFGDITQDTAKLASLLQTFVTPRARALAQGTVVAESDDKIWVEMPGVKSEGVIHAEEFNVRGLGQKPAIGNRVEVWLQHTGKGENGSETVISFVKGAQIRAWKALEASYKNKKPVDGIILGSSTGASGYIVAIMPYAARAFLPISQLDQNTRTQEGIQMLKADLHPYIITRMDKGGNIIVSRRI